MPKTDSLVANTPSHIGLKAFPLLRLPLELRQQIYFLAVGDLPAIPASWTEPGFSTMVSEIVALGTTMQNLVLTNRQVCGEMDVVSAARLQQMKKHHREAQTVLHELWKNCYPLNTGDKMEAYVKVLRYRTWLKAEKIWIWNVLAFARGFLPAYGSVVRDLRVVMPNLEDDW